MKRIPLTQGKFALVVDSDYALVSGRDWHVTRERKGKQYAASTNGGVMILMHRLIMGARKRQRIDHRNRNGLDNQRINLRFSTQSQNLANSGIPSHNSSGLKGVSFHKAARKWRAYLRGKHLGLFTTKELAVATYDAALVANFGNFALTNRQLLQS